MRIVPHDLALAPAIEAFNARLRAGGSDWEFPAGAVSATRGAISLERYLCVDGEFVRGGYNLIRQSAQVAGSVQSVSFVRLPLSEGIVDPKFAMVGALILKDAIKRGGLTFSLGMGGLDKPLPKLYRALGAKLVAVPFYFRVVNASGFLRNIVPLRSNPMRCALFDAVAMARLANLPVKAYHAWRSRGAKMPFKVELVDRFGDWVNEIWEGSHDGYSFLCVRRRDELNLRLPPGDTRLHRLQVSSGGRLIGWAAVTDNQLSAHPYFGSMRLGALVDSLSLPGFEVAVMAAATDFLLDRRVDLIVTNQLHRDWRHSVERCGYLRFSSSNFVFAAAPALAKQIESVDPDMGRVHLNRGDGDGPINL
jgi:hypothetical protein